MKETGIVRRIDELGRVVIPKEIRKTLRLREGDPLEIYTEDEMLKFKKYSPIASIDNFARDLCESLNMVTNKTAFICDTDNILASSGNNSKLIAEKPLSQNLQKMILKREIYSKLKQANIINLIDDNLPERFDEAVYPVISAGDVIGGVALITFKENDLISAEERKLLAFVCEFLSLRFQ